MIGRSTVRRPAAASASRKVDDDVASNDREAASRDHRRTWCAATVVTGLRDHDSTVTPRCSGSAPRKVGAVIRPPSARRRAIAVRRRARSRSRARRPRPTGRRRQQAGALRAAPTARVAANVEAPAPPRAPTTATCAPRACPSASVGQPAHERCSSSGRHLAALGAPIITAPRQMRVSARASDDHGDVVTTRQAGTSATSRRASCPTRTQVALRHGSVPRPAPSPRRAVTPAAAHSNRMRSRSAASP